MFYLHMKGGEKTPILSNEDSNINFYLYKIVERTTFLSKQCGTCGVFYLIFILNVRFFLYEISFFLAWGLKHLLVWLNEWVGNAKRAQDLDLILNKKKRYLQN